MKEDEDGESLAWCLTEDCRLSRDFLNTGSRTLVRIVASVEHRLDTHVLRGGEILGVQCRRWSTA